MKIKDLFEVGYGQREFHNKEWLDGEEGKNILISSKGMDNGLYGFFKIKNRYKAPFISVPSTGTIGQAFVQTKDCSVDDNCLVLIPKEELDFEKLNEVAFQIRLNKWRYRYGRQLTPKRLKEQEIVLENTGKNWEEFEKKITPKESKKEKITENKNITIMKVKDLCNIEKKTAIPQNAMELNGKTPYVTTTSLNNGVSQFVKEEPNFEGRCLSVAMNGSVGEVFFQIQDFITSGDNAILRLKGNYNLHFLIFVGTLIKRHKWRYNYYRKMNLNKLKNLTLPIPMKDNNIDFDYIKKIVENCYGFEELKEYL